MKSGHFYLRKTYLRMTWHGGRRCRQHRGEVEFGSSEQLKTQSVCHSDSEILAGTLVLRGTRVPVQSIFDHLKAGDSIEVF